MSSRTHRMPSASPATSLSTDAITSRDPITSTDPTESPDRTGPTHPANLTEPTGPAGTADPTGPAHRTLVLAVPDWPCTAAAIDLGIGADEPLAVLGNGRITASNASAGHAGVHIGLGKRAAQLRCPRMRLVARDEERDHRVFAAGIGVLEGLVARFSLLAPGTVSIPASSLRRSHPTEEATVEELLTGLTDRTGWEFLPGLADTPFAALIASRTSTRVAPGRTAAFLHGVPVTVLAEVDPEAFAPLVPVFEHLGLRALGDLAALPAADVAARFGEAGTRAHRLAAGLPDRMPIDHVRAREYRVESAVEPATGRSDVLSFHARSLATELLGRIRAAGLVCTQVTIGLTATTGEDHRRTWRIEEMNESTVADRLRWQSEGWLHTTTPAPGGAGTSEAGSAATGAEWETDAPDGISAISLAAAELLAPLSTQRSLFDQHPGQIAHTLERVQGLFGADSVLVPALQGGRDPAETNLWTPWQQTPHPVRDPEAPWPGQIPAPRPTLVEHTPVDLLDAHGNIVTARPSGLDNAPAFLRVPAAGDRPRFSTRITDWSATWPVETRWWDPETAQYRVRLQVVDAEGRAFLLCKEQGQWYLTGRYA